MIPTREKIALDAISALLDQRDALLAEHQEALQWAETVRQKGPPDTIQAAAWLKAVAAAEEALKCKP